MVGFPIKSTPKIARNGRAPELLEGPLPDSEAGLGCWLSLPTTNLLRSCTSRGGCPGCSDGGFDVGFGIHVSSKDVQLVSLHPRETKLEPGTRTFVPGDLSGRELFLSEN